MRLKLSMAVIGSAICFMTFSCKKVSSFKYPPSSVSLYEMISEDRNNFSFFKLAVDRIGFGTELAQGKYTLLAPTNAVFSRAGFNAQKLQELSLDSLTMLVKNHIIPGELDQHALTGTQELAALSGGKIPLQHVGSNAFIAGADITNGDNGATNGFMYVINTVLFKRRSIVERLRTYAAATTDAQFTYVLEALKRASAGSINYLALLDDPAAAYTFFAPNNGAFIDGGYPTLASVTAAPVNRMDDLIKRHLVDGKKYTAEFDTLQPMMSRLGVPVYADRLKPGANTYNYFNSINAISGAANMEGGSGVIHTVSRFLPLAIDQTTGNRIVQDTSLTFFYAALQRGSEAGELNFVQMVTDAAASYTVFAVNNNGFRSAGYPSIASINDQDPKVISNILRLHFLNKRVNNINIEENGKTPTLLYALNANNEMKPVNLTVSSSGGYKVKGDSNVNTIPVISGNIVTTNGLLNIIGEVLAP